MSKARGDEIEEVQFLSKDEALAMLPDGDTIHTFRQAGIMLIGARWQRHEVERLIEACDPQMGGPQCVSTGYGLVLEDRAGYVFIETRTDAK